MYKNGFTLVEVSIVLVIIGLVVGGILIGQDLISAAAGRAQIAQIEKYNTAVNVFQGKYGGLPGDLALSSATQFGFVTNGCDGSYGNRDGNGVITGFQNTGFQQDQDQFLAETGMFWEDLSSAGLIDGTFPNNGATPRDCSSGYPVITLTPGLNYVGDFIPAGKIGYGTFLYVYPDSADAQNWYGLSAVTGTGGGGGFILMSNPSIPVIAAYNIDKKIDDGLPTSGQVTANYSTNRTITASPNAASPSSTTCYDTTSNQYSTSQNGGGAPNCAISFKLLQ